MPARDEIAREIRRTLHDTLGSAFASKASDALCLALATSPAAALGELAAPETAQSSQPQPVIIELEEEGGLAEAHGRWASFEAILGGQLAAAPEGVPEAERRRIGAHLRQAVRTSASEEMRRRFEAVSRALRERLEESAASAGPGLEGAGGERPFVDVCWLNSTASAATFTPALAEIAASDQVRALDAPRRLQREVDVTGPLLGCTAFREQFAAGGAGVLVAVIDTEVDHLHPRYDGRVSRKENYTGEAWGAPGNHGTAVAGIVHELAPEATIWSYKIFAQKWWLDSNDFGGSKAVQQALEDGAQVANCSWGVGPAADGTSREARAFDTAWGFGLTLVKSAGNAGPGAGSLTVPADAAGVIVVGATDRGGQGLADYSSRGPTGHGLERPHLVAPGGLQGNGLGIRSTLPDNRFEIDPATFGTSFAAPHVTAAIALLLSHKGDLGPDAIRDHLIACCSPLAGLGADEQGAGLLDLMSVSPPA